LLLYNKYVMIGMVVLLCVIVAVFIYCFILWLIWKYILPFPFKQIAGAIYQVTPPIDWFFSFYDTAEQFVFGTNSDRMKALATSIASGVGLMVGEAMSRADPDHPGTPTDPTSNLQQGPPDDANTAALRVATRACAKEYNPYAYPEPLSQILVRNELTKCNLGALATYYTAVQPDVGALMTTCQRVDGTGVIPAAEFLDTSAFVDALTADGNTTRYDDQGMRVVAALDGRTVATQVTVDGIMAVTDASGNTVYLNAARKRVVPTADGSDFVPVSDNLNHLLDAFRQQPATAADPLDALLHREDDLIACQLAAMQSTPAGVSAAMGACDDNEPAVPDPDGSYAGAKEYASASVARQQRVGTCQKTTGAQLAKLSSS